MSSYTANEFRQGKQRQVFNEAYKGEEVVINHDRYPDVVFVLVARKREALRPPILKEGDMSTNYLRISEESKQKIMNQPAFKGEE